MVPASKSGTSLAEQLSARPLFRPGQRNHLLASRTSSSKKTTFTDLFLRSMICTLSVTQAVHTARKADVCGNYAVKNGTAVRIGMVFCIEAG